MSISRLEVLYETKTLKKAHNRLKIVFKIHFNLLNPIFVKIENPHSKHGKNYKKEVNTAIMKLEGTPIVIYTA
jgi:hypothetical protein